MRRCFSICVLLIAITAGVCVGLPVHSTSAQSPNDQVWIVVDKSGQGICILDGAACPTDVVVTVALERVLRTEAEAAHQPYLPVSATSAQVNAFSAPLARRIAATHARAYYQSHTVHPLTNCPAQYVTNHLIVSTDDGSIHWNWTYYLQPNSPTTCVVSGVELDLSPYSGSSGSERVDAAGLYLTQYPYGWFDGANTTNGQCDTINSDPVIKGFRGTTVPETSGPETLVNIYSDSGCNTVVTYETVLWQ